MVSMSLTSKIRPDLRYSVLRTALSTFETPPSQLSSDKLQAVINQVEREYNIQSKILSSKEARDIVIPEDSIDRAFHEVSDRYESPEELYSDLSNNNIDEAQFRESLARDIKVETILDRVTSNSAEVSDIDVMIYYHMHQEKMKKPQVRKGRHILITINEEIPENTRTEAYKKISEIYDKLKKKTKMFAEYAMKYSECPTALNGGELSNITTGVLYKELEDVLFKLPEKQMSSVVESPIGFHIMYCEEIQHAKTLSIAEAKPAIRKLLEDRRKKICQKTWLSKLLAGDKNV
jgi:nitrogen fixation protein NifM